MEIVNTAAQSSSPAPGQRTSYSKLRASVALATYNGAKWIVPQLNSIATQTTLPSEIVVCDDGSVDDTVALVSQFARTAPFDVRVFRNSERLGFVQNFAKASKLCQGDVIFLCDQDDIWSPTKIYTLLNAFTASRKLMVVLNDQLICSENLDDASGSKLSNMASFGISKAEFITGCCSAHRKEWQQVALPVPESAASHDSWINGLAHTLGVTSVLDVPLQLYRRHSSNASASIFSSVHPLGRLARIQRNLELLGRDGNAGKVAVLKSSVASRRAFIERLQSRSDEIEALGLQDNLSEALEELESDCSARSRRISVLERPLLARQFAIAALWWSGGYNRFNGWKSALSDGISFR